MATRNGLKRGPLLSFLVLGLFADQTGAAMVSQVRLADNAACSERSIRNHRKKWEEAGLLVSRIRCGPRGLIQYQLAEPLLIDRENAGVGRAFVSPSIQPVVRKPPVARPAPSVPTKATGNEEVFTTDSFARAPKTRAKVWEKSPQPLQIVQISTPPAKSTERGQTAPVSILSPVRAIPVEIAASRPIPATANRTLGALSPTSALGAVKDALEWMRASQTAKSQRERRKSSAQIELLNVDRDHFAAFTVTFPAYPSEKPEENLGVSAALIAPTAHDDDTGKNSTDRPPDKPPPEGQ